ncbi:MAG: PrsW family intramembrane metalloprotease [Euryarchaeota archaeon]|nr:PrsW family intramembrane metalloprotease [Euryarchaeota archaeon]
MSGALRTVATISKWEVKRSLTSMSRNVLPLAVVLFILLILATGFTAESGMHLQDHMYIAGVESPEIAEILAADDRFTVYEGNAEEMLYNPDFDLIISGSTIYLKDTEKSRAALRALDKDYIRYKSWICSHEKDLFAAYPLWIDLRYVKSELDFISTQSGQTVAKAPDTSIIPKPDNVVSKIPSPSAIPEFTEEELRTELISGVAGDDRISRYTGILTSKGELGDFKTPSQLSPPLPFDSIMLIFVFIFPLYFTSQFFMMSIMNERIERKGEILLSTPVKPWQIIVGKALPYLILMITISAVLTAFTGGSLLILAPLFPVILFFLANALIIGMISRSFKELSFVSIFFSTIATSYLFFPSIFANIHIVSLISPITLIILQIQGDGFTLTDYVYSTSLFYLTSAVLFYAGTHNFNEERLFSQHRFLSRILEFISSAISLKKPYLSLFAISLLSIPFVFMAQLMLLVLLFNLPMPLSLIVLLVFAAFIEELAKSVGIYAFFIKWPDFFTVKNVLIASAVIASGFLIGEKLLLFATLAQVSESIFGAVLFTSLSVLWMPLTLHFAGILTVTAILKLGGRRAYVPGVFAATIVHSLYNLCFILGWMS